MKPVQTYIDQASGIEVKVYAPQKTRNKQRKPRAPKSTVITQSMMTGIDAYDAVVQFGVLYEEPADQTEAQALEERLTALSSPYNRHARGSF